MGASYPQLPRQLARLAMLRVPDPWPSSLVYLPSDAALEAKNRCTRRRTAHKPRAAMFRPKLTEAAQAHLLQGRATLT